jgi:hypothetical protein
VAVSFAALALSSNAGASRQRGGATPPDIPLGIGVAHVTPVAGAALQFYRPPRIGEKPGDYEPTDRVRFGPGVPSVDIVEAPPWLVPQHLKMDYEIFQLRVVTLTPDWLEVIGSMRTGQLVWIDRSAARFMAWPEFLLSVHSIEAIDAATNPVRARPLDSSPILSAARAALPPLAIRGEWMQVATHELADRMPPEGWIRWRRGERLLISWNPLG